MSNTFGTDYNKRKAVPVFDGLLMYFPDACAAVASVSHKANEQHNPGEPMHWARGKSMNQYDTALRHMIDHRTGGGFSMKLNYENNGWIIERYDTDGERHLAKAAWRILAALQLDIEAERAEKVAQSVESGVLANCSCGRFVVTDITPKFWSMSDDKMHTIEKCE